MDRISTQSEWQQRARAVLPAGGFGNFDAGMIVDQGVGSRIWDAGCNLALHCNGNLKEMTIVAKNSPKVNSFIIKKTSEFYKILS